MIYSDTQTIDTHANDTTEFIISLLSPTTETETDPHWINLHISLSGLDGMYRHKAIVSSAVARARPAGRYIAVCISRSAF